MNNASPLFILLELSKFKITFAVTFTTAMGYLLGRQSVSINAGTYTTQLSLGETVQDCFLISFGVWLVASAAAAINELQEIQIDSKMNRTKNRPLPRNLISRPLAWGFVFLCLGLGFASATSVQGKDSARPIFNFLSYEASLQIMQANLIFLLLFSIFWYNLVYTYLKRVTSLAVIPGALIGAVPPFIGWVAAGGSIENPHILWICLFMFIWQIPHFWLLLLMYGHEYTDAGLPSLTTKFSVSQLCRVTFIWTISLAVFTILMSFQVRELLYLPWNVLMLIAPIWLIFGAFPILKERQEKKTYLKVFLKINLFALAIMIFLTLNALGLSFRAF